MSIKRIADIVGVSPATVSRVLNNPEHRCRDVVLSDKIREVARNTGYIPNSNARELKTGKTSNEIYAVDILMARFDSFFEDTFFGEVLKIIESEMMKNGCKVGDVLTVTDIAKRKNDNRTARATGLIILGKCPYEITSELKREYRAVVAFDRNPTNYEMDEIVCNGATAATMAIEYLMELGHRKIAYVGDCTMESRYNGYYECLIKHRMPIVYDYIVPTRQTREEGFRAYELLAREGVQPTGVFCANDVSALGFLQAIKEHNGKKKKNIYRPAVISIDDIEEAATFSPMLTTVRIPKEEMAHMAVVILRDRLAGKHGECVRVELPCRIMVRESSGIHI